MPERELKLLVDHELALPALDDLVPGAAEREVDERSIDDTYHDTDDLRLARWGCTVRFREGDGWTVKLPTAGTGPVLTREEIVFGGDRSSRPDEVTALVRSLTRGAALDVVARFDTARTATTWTDADGALVVEVVDDRVSVDTGDGRRNWREVEIELGPGTGDKAARRLAKAIQKSARVAGEPAPTVDRRPKLVRALGERAEAAPDIVVAEPGPEATGRDVIALAIARSATRLVLQLPAARLGRDPEAVHQARVATRRLRSDLRTFGPLLDRGWADALSDELRWLAGSLGGVRDADVLLDRVRAVVAGEPGVAGVGAERVVASLERRRRREHRRLLADLDSDRTDALLDRLVEAAADPATGPTADGPAVDGLGPLLTRRWRRLAKAVDALDDPPPPEDLHRVRILAKRTRYAADAAAPVGGRKTRRLAKALARVQDSLGELNDAAVAEAWLSTTAARSKGDTAFTAGRICQLIAAQAAAASADWRTDLDRAARAADALSLG